MRDHDGVFIVFEGIDGAGTTTQIERYAEYLRAQRRAVRVTQEPSSGPIGSLLRLALAGRINVGPSFQAQTMALLFAADRLDHLAHDIQPHLRDGSVVLSDRYDMSSIAYQAASARLDSDELESFQAWVRSLNRYALRPDAIVVIEVDPTEAERRRSERSSAPELYEEVQLQERLAELYASAESLSPGDRIVRIDGNASADDVALRICAALTPIVGS
ncbi:MAG TPA: dTMP kinase [Polyangiaceae bacterium]|nr:dTMP kinase [Polyangiaceae bacterium]